MFDLLDYNVLRTYKDLRTTLYRTMIENMRLNLSEEYLKFIKKYPEIIVIRYSPGIHYTRKDIEDLCKYLLHDYYVLNIKGICKETSYKSVYDYSEYDNQIHEHRIKETDNYFWEDDANYYIKRDNLFTESFSKEEYCVNVNKIEKIIKSKFKKQIESLKKESETELKHVHVVEH